ncbi:MAG: hypothetical protein EHM35_06005 [Planctomycetaceae bacterium]|nr:MAG: hypothetical protein EHM35_06005 [Planctomycetaceae bacterium]
MVDATSWQNLATDIDAAMTTIDAKRVLAIRPSSARILNDSTQLLTNSVLATLAFATEDWDNGGLANLGINNDRLTLTPGIWLVAAGVRPFGMTNVTHVEIQVSLNGVTNFQHRIGPLYSGATPVIQTHGLLVVTASTDYVTALTAWSGTGGPATAIGGYLQATKMRDYP